MTKRIASILIALLMQLNALFSFGNTADLSPAADAYYDGDTVVPVIVELEQGGLLDDVTDSAQRDALIDGIAQNPRYQQIVQTQSALRQRIAQTFSLADFSDSYSYYFVANGFSLAIPYRFVSALKKLPGVKDVTVSTTFSAPRDIIELSEGSAYGNADAFTGIQAAHEAGYTGAGTVIAVLDTGFELGHEVFASDVKNPRFSRQDILLKSAFGFLNTIVPQLSAHYISEKIPYRWDYAKVDKGVHNPNSSHGTHVAGIAAGNSKKKIGAAPDAQLLLMKVFEDKQDALAKEYVILAALDDCVKLKADVVNLSLGSACGQAPDNIFTGAVVNRLRRAGINVVASGGNAGSLASVDNVPGDYMNIDLFDYGTANSPGSYAPFLSVASSAINGNDLIRPDVISVKGKGSLMLSSFSAWGPTEDLRLKPEITAPGSNIYSSIPENDYGYKSGTSMASPYYAGTAALMKQYVQETKDGIPQKQINEFVNALLMSTATVFRAYNQKSVYSPRRQGAGFLNLSAAMSTPAYLTQTDGVSRPKIELGEVNDGVLRLSFQIHNLTDAELQYNVHELVLTDSYRTVGGKYENTMAATVLGADAYSVTDDEGLDETRVVCVPPRGTKTVSMTVTMKPDFLNEYRNIFKNGFFLEGFLVLEDEAKTAPVLSLPFMGFYGDWERDMLFDYTIYDETPPYLSGEWGLAVSDGDVYHPLGANIFETGHESHIDTKYCAYSKHAYGMKKPYVTVSVGLLRNAKRMDFNLFTASGIFRYCGSTLLDYCRKTTGPSSATHGVLWGGKQGLVNSQHYVYKVSTRAQNYKSGRQTIEFPFVVDNDAPQVVSCSYAVENGQDILTVSIKDNHYLMGFQLLTEDEQSIGSVSFKGIEPENGLYTYTVNVSEMAKRLTAQQLQTLKLYVVDYAYNETFAQVSLSQNTIQPTTVDRSALRQARGYLINKQAVALDTTNEEGEKLTGPFSALIEQLEKWN